MANTQNVAVNNVVLSVDSSIHNRPGFIYAKQYDSNSRFIRVKLVGEDGVIKPTGLFQLNARRPDGEHVEVPGHVDSDSTILFSLKSSVLAIPGDVACDVSMFASESDTQVMLTSSTFHIVVAESMFSLDAWEGDDDTNLFTEAIATIAAHASQASASAQAAKTSENNAAKSEEAVEQSKVEIQNLKEEIDSSGSNIKEDIATANTLLEQAIDENQSALAACEETKGYRDEAASHKQDVIDAKTAAEDALDEANAAKDAAKTSELSAAESEGNAEQSAIQAASSLQAVQELEAEISAAGEEVKKDLSSAADTLSQAQEVSASAISAAEEASGYRDEAKDHAEAAETSKQAAATSESNAKASEESAATHDSNSLQTEERVNELLAQATQKANDAKDSADEASVILNSVQEVALQVETDAKLAQDKASESAISAQNAAQSEANAKSHADTIQETVDTLADDYQAVVEEVEALKERVIDATINPDDLGLEYEEENGYIYPSYMEVRSKNGLGVAAFYDAGKIETISSDVDTLKSDKLDKTALSDAIDEALAQAKASGEFNGKDGDSITIENVMTGTTVGGADTHTITFSDGTNVTISDGAAGKAGEDGASATHSWNGTVLTITSASGTSSADLKGADGAPGLTPVKGTDYYTEADKAEMVDLVLAALPTWNGGSY